MTVALDRPRLIADLKALIIEECDKGDVAPEQIDDNEEIMGGGLLDLDSLDALQIALAVKDRWGVRIEGGPDSRRAFASVGALADFILADLAARGAAGA
jgi:acyl carrier protein